MNFAGLLSCPEVIPPPPGIGRMNICFGESFHARRICDQDIFDSLAAGKNTFDAMASHTGYAVCTVRDRVLKMIKRGQIEIAQPGAPGHAARTYRRAACK